MVLGCAKSLKCSLCKKGVGEVYWIDLQKRLQVQMELYSQEGFVEAQLSRKSDYRTLAFEAGLIRPFALLVSMSPDMRNGVGNRLMMQLLKYKHYGDPHAEAARILFHKKKGIRRRSGAITENIGISVDPNWYQILRRAIKDLAGYSTFKSKAGDATIENSQVFNDDVISAMEMELLEAVAKRYLLMLPFELRMKASELLASPEIQEVFAPVKDEGMDSEILCTLFIAIVLSHGVESNLQDIHTINPGDFLRFLKSYLQGKTPGANRLKTAQHAASTIALVLTKIVVLKVVAHVIAFLTFPPVAVAIEIGFWAVALPVVVTVLLSRSSRDVSCPAVVCIVLQKFILTTDKIQHPNLLHPEEGALPNY
jgi:uncharacterized membrane protein YqaE (UPF0057 family)